MGGQNTGRRARRLDRERCTVETMIRMYCHDNHGSRGGLCPECLELQEYSRQKVERCPFLSDKPACSKCPVHCYQPVMRVKIRAVMRYSGPRMVLRHPVMAVFHVVDSLRSRRRPVRS